MVNGISSSRAEAAQGQGLPTSALICKLSNSAMHFVNLGFVPNNRRYLTEFRRALQGLFWNRFETPHPRPDRPRRQRRQMTHRGLAAQFQMHSGLGPCASWGQYRLAILPRGIAVIAFPVAGSTMVCAVPPRWPATNSPLINSLLCMISLRLDHLTMRGKSGSATAFLQPKALACLGGWFLQHGDIQQKAQIFDDGSDFAL